MTATFFEAALRALARQHGNRLGPIPEMEELRRHLAAAERAYRDLPRVVQLWPPPDRRAPEDA